MDLEDAEKKKILLKIGKILKKYKKSYQLVKGHKNKCTQVNKY